MTNATTNVIAKIAAAVAGLGLVVSALAPMAMAQTTTTTTTTTTSASFTRDLTIGSTGADVTALQNWLIAKGFSIPAGATGYFGTQTRAALAAYQASASITPAAGYFGPITRAKVMVVVPPTPIPDEDEDENDEEKTAPTEKEVRKVLEDAKDSLEEAEDDVDESDATNTVTREAEDMLDEADDFIQEAEDRLWDKDYEEALELLEDAESKIEEAIDSLDEDEDDNTVTAEVTTSAETREQDGADNDFGNFQITMGLTARGNDVYLSRSLSTAFDFEVQDADGDAVTAGTMTGLLQSSADTSGNYYLIKEDEEEEFTITVTFNPQASDEKAYYGLQLLKVKFADSAESPDIEFNLRPESRYETDYVYIAD